MSGKRYTGRTDPGSFRSPTSLQRVTVEAFNQDGTRAFSYDLVQDGSLVAEINHSASGALTITITQHPRKMKS